MTAGQQTLNLGAAGLNSNISLLLRLDGTNGSTSIVDSSIYADDKVANAGQQISTTQSKWGGSSLQVTRLDPSPLAWSGARFIRPSGEALTIEWWYRQVTRVPSNTGPQICNLFNDVGQSMFFVTQGALANNQVFHRVGTGDAGTNLNFTPDGGGWAHMAHCVSEDNSYSFYINGTEVRTGTMTSNAGSTASFYVGGNNNTNATACEVYIDDLRYTKGVRLYTGTTITVPSGPF